MPLKFTKKFVSSQPFESAAVFDVDGDGVLDIFSGGFWYQGPDFRRWHSIGPVRAVGEYFDDFSAIPMDINGNGRLDIITGGWWGDSLRWRENPGEAGKPWPEHVIADKIGNVETTRAWDIDGDGELEIVPNTPGSPLCAYKLIRDGGGKGTGKFTKHILFPRPCGHGLGFGDIDGDGRGEIIVPKGLLKAPAEAFSGPWTMHEAFDLGWDCGIPMLVVDVNGDGVNDLIVGRAHSYGLDWIEQKKDASGAISWHKHAIDPFNSQYHDLQWADIDGDGEMELITGKRFRAHCGSDPGEFDDVGIYYFKWNGESFSKQIIGYGPPGEGSGCGIFFALADLRGTGRMDVVAPGKDGLQIFYNEGM